MNLRWAKCCDLCKYSNQTNEYIYHLRCIKFNIDVNMEQICDYYEYGGD